MCDPWAESRSCQAPPTGLFLTYAGQTSTGDQCISLNDVSRCFFECLERRVWGRWRSSGLCLRLEVILVRDQGLRAFPEPFRFILRRFRRSTPLNFAVNDSVLADARIVWSSAGRSFDLSTAQVDNDLVVQTASLSYFVLIFRTFGFEQSYVCYR